MRTNKTKIYQVTQCYSVHASGDKINESCPDDTIGVQSLFV